MRDLMAQGGVVLYAIAAVSVAAWIFLALQWQRLRAGETISDLARLLVETLRGTGDPERLIRSGRLEALLAAERTALSRDLPPAAVLAGVAPLLGLLGTIFGIIRTFFVLAGPGAHEAAGFADGIAQALVTTQAGLIAALPVLLLHAWLSGRVRRRIERVRILVNREVAAARERG